MESLTDKGTLLLSIIIPVFNGEKYINRCIDSILSQGLSQDSYEVILVNDGSKDNSLNICNSLTKLYHNFILLDQANSGQGTARNKGINIARGQYTTFADIDDFFNSNVLKDICEILRARSPEILVTRNTAMNSRGEFISQPQHKYEIATKYIGEELLLDNYLPAAVWSKFYLTAFLKDNAIDFLPSIIHEDVEMNMRAFAIAKDVEFSNIVTYVYYWNPLSTDKLMNEDKKRISYISDLVIAHSYRHLWNRYAVSLSLADYFNRYSNSLVVSVLLQLIKEGNRLKKSSVKQILQKIKELRLIPIYGKTRSKKADIIAKILFSYKLFNLLIRCRNRL